MFALNETNRRITFASRILPQGLESRRYEWHTRLSYTPAVSRTDSGGYILSTFQCNSVDGLISHLAMDVWHVSCADGLLPLNPKTDKPYLWIPKFVERYVRQGFL